MQIGVQLTHTLVLFQLDAFPGMGWQGLTVDLFADISGISVGYSIVVALIYRGLETFFPTASPAFIVL